MGRVSIVLLPVLLGAAACAPQYGTVAMGSYSDFRPYARLLATSIDLELGRAAHVAVIGITIPTPGYPERPVLFAPLYPRYETDQTFFEAGRHRIVARRVSLREPPNCRRGEKPTMTGCRRPPHLYPGTGAPSEIAAVYPADPGHYLVIASEEFIDPYALSDDLFEMAYERGELGDALKTRKVDQAAADLERALLDRPGSPIWGAFYVSGK